MSSPFATESCAPSPESFDLEVIPPTVRAPREELVDDAELQLDLRFDARGADDGRIGHVGEEPLEQRRLAHAGLADDQRDLRAARLGARERGEQLVALGGPADEPVSHRPPRRSR